jgi:hypothetical protein
MKLYLLLTILAFTAISCVKGPAEDNGTDSINIRVTQCSSLPVNKNTISVCFDSVANESRCPQDVQCVWQGYANTKWTIHSEGQSQSFELSTLDLPNGLKKVREVLGYKIELKDLLPYPRFSNPNAYSEYQAIISVTKL